MDHVNLSQPTESAAAKTPVVKSQLGGDWMALSVAGGGAQAVGKAHTAKTAWLLSFIDLTSILVGFFVLVFATQTMEQEAWRNVTGSFRATFAPPLTAAAVVVPSGNPNALAVVKLQREALIYLDSLLRGQLATDAVWGGLVGEVQDEGDGRVMVYKVDGRLLDVAEPSARDAWLRLGGVVRSWKNPVAVRWVVGEENVPQVAAQVMAVVGILAKMGVNITGEVVVKRENMVLNEGVYWVIGEKN